MNTSRSDTDTLKEKPWAVELIHDGRPVTHLATSYETVGEALKTADRLNGLLNRPFERLVWIAWPNQYYEHLPQEDTVRITTIPVPEPAERRTKAVVSIISWNPNPNGGKE